MVLTYEDKTGRHLQCGEKLLKLSVLRLDPVTPQNEARGHASAIR